MFVLNCLLINRVVSSFSEVIVCLGQEILSLYKGFLYCVFNTESPLSEVPLYVIVINQPQRFVCNIEAQIPRAKPEVCVLLYCIQSEGLFDNYFLAHCFYGYNKHVFSPQELYECLPWPSGTVY